MKLGIIDLDTGEIVREIEENQIIKVTKKGITEKREVVEWEINNFFKGHVDEIKLAIKELSHMEMAFIFAIVPYVNYEDCCLKYENENCITPKGFMEITRMSENTVYGIIKSLVSKYIMCRVKNGSGYQYVLNPWLFSKGQRINKSLQTFFQDYEVKTQGNKRWRDIKK